MRIRSKHSIDMLGGSLVKNLWAFAIPLMLSTLLQNLFNAADTIVVGRFAGQLELAAVGATGSLCAMIIGVFNGLSLGSNVLIARYLGAGDHDKVRRAVHTSMALSVVGGLILMVFGYFFSRPLLVMMSTPEDIIDLSALYMRIYFIGAFFSLIYNFGASILRSNGDTKRPLYYLSISGVINVVLNLIFIIQFKMGVAGVALATLISQLFAAILIVLSLMKQTNSTRLYIKQLRLEGKIVWDIIKIGVPAGVQGMMYSLSNIVVQSSINSFGSSAIVAGNSAASNINSFIYMWESAFCQACVTFTSQNIGAGNRKRVKSIMVKTLLLTLAGSLVLSVAVYAFGNFFLGFYTTDAEVIRIGMIRLLYVGLPSVINCIVDVFVSSLRGMGYSLMPTVSMIVGICLTRLIWIWTVFPIYNTLESVFLCYPISWTVASTVLGILWIVGYKKLIKQQPEITA